MNHPEMADHYECAECNFDWFGKPQPCPDCGSELIRLVTPNPEETH